MFYEPRRHDHGLPIDPLKALVAPRPIGWISTLSPDGVANLAPYSFFNAVGENPPYVMFASASLKDTQRNAEATGEFVCSLATYALRDAMNASAASVPPGVDEFEVAGVAKAPSRLVKPPRVAASPAALECRWWKTVQLPGDDNYAVVFGEVVGVHIDDTALRNGRVDTASLKLIARLGYAEYALIDEAFRIDRPK